MKLLKNTLYLHKPNDVGLVTTLNFYSHCWCFLDNRCVVSKDVRNDAFFFLVLGKNDCSICKISRAYLKVLINNSIMLLYKRSSDIYFDKYEGYFPSSSNIILIG